jgi:hypothetical protein
LLGILVILWLGLSLLSGGSETRKDFARLSEILLPGMTGETEIAPSLSEGILEGERREADLKRIASGRGQLAMIAKQIFDQRNVAAGIVSEGAAALGTALRGRMENSMAEGGKQTKGPSTGDGKILEGLAGFLKQGVNTVKLFADMQTRVAALVELAPRYGPRPAQDFAVDVNFAEQEPGPFEKLMGQVHSDGGKQQLWLTQRQSPQLHDCIVVVRLVRPNAASLLHGYYVPDWQKGESKTVEFTTGFTGDSDPAVNRVIFQFFAREITSPKMEISRTGNAWPYFKQ